MNNETLTGRPARLLLKDGTETIGEFQVNGVVSIGKERGSDIQLLNPSVAFKHAVVEPRGAHFILRDLGSEHGTWVNNRRIQEAALSDGDQVRVGETTFLFLRPGEQLRSGADFAISYTAGADDMKQVAMAMPTGQLSAPIARVAESAPADSAELDRLTRLLEIGRTLASTTDMENILEGTMDAVMDNLDPSRATLLLKHPASGELYTTAARTRKKKKERTRISMSRTIVSAALKRQEAVLIADTESLTVSSEHTIRRQGIRSAICVPMMFNGQALGVLYADCLDLTKTFDGADLRFAVGLASMAAVAIVNARLLLKVTQEQKLRLELQQKMGADGSAQLSAGLAPRDVTVIAIRLLTVGELVTQGQTDRVQTYVQEMLSLLHDQILPRDGVIASIGGRTVLAAWGLRKAAESDAKMALAAAFEIRGIFAGLNAGRLVKGLRPLGLTLAISAGRVMAGQVALRGGRPETILLGGPVEEALRLAASAGTDQILVAGAAHALMADAAEFQTLEPLPGAGGEKPMGVYAALRPRAG